ncbi:hypothetical protein HMPREF0988_00848 [Lachnospiraceae bacterium 1_4_56FAA]|nr:hypothetical protein HMPREF0988_00848 [Lachnospiraceae bacterium 1_4_56FAA]
MAVTKIHPIKTTLNKAIDYICNPDKTDDKILISSYGCSYETADIEFAFTLSKARDKGGQPWTPFDTVLCAGGSQL